MSTSFSRRGRSELSAALVACRSAFIGVALFSVMLSVLYLTGSFYMLEVYDRVLPSRSMPTLVGITLLALLLFAFQGGLDIVRSRILVRGAGSVDEAVHGRVYQVQTKLPPKASAPRGLQSLQDLDQVRAKKSELIERRVAAEDQLRRVDGFIEWCKGYGEHPASFSSSASQDRRDDQ